MTADAEIYRLTTSNRLMIVEVLQSLDDAQWDRATLCTGWTVKHMAAHLVQPMLVGFGRFVLTAMRYRGDTDKTVDHFARRLARRPRAELTALLGEHAEDRVNPPRVGPMGPFAESCVHLRDIARPLGLDVNVPIDHWRTVLNYRRSPPPWSRPVAWLHLVATDTDWANGCGALVTGPVEAIGMAATGRPAALRDLDGPGRDILASRFHAN